MSRRNDWLYELCFHLKRGPVRCRKLDLMVATGRMHLSVAIAEIERLVPGTVPVTSDGRYIELDVLDFLSDTLS